LTGGGEKTPKKIDRISLKFQFFRKKKFSFDLCHPSIQVKIESKPFSTNFFSSKDKFGKTFLFHLCSYLGQTWIETQAQVAM
jgi:hypothetical protein